MKKIIAMICAVAMGLTMLAGCTTNQGETDVETKTPALEDIKTAIQTAYTEEEYMPTEIAPDEMFDMEFPITADLVEEKIATMPMIGMHPDRVVIIKATEGNGEALEQELIEIRDKKVAEFMDYPQNLAKTQAAQVVRQGDYVAFLLVGAVNEDMDASEEEALTFAEEEVKKAVDAFKAQF